IESALRIGQDKYKDYAEVTKNYGDNIPKIKCSPAKINQIILNLLNNSVDAIKDHIESGSIVITTTADDQNVHITVQDNGKGITADHLDQIFEPFFTTKGAGVGTGLGLAISNQIVEEHQGHIKAESKEGEGATFTIVLPIHSDDDSEADTKVT
ncbi:hypothetical protein TI05_17305, partial [Achromatium sp. WMS3]